MLNTSYARRGIAVASHSLAAQSALAVLREGGNAIEAMVSAASTIAVVYPHMTGIGGDAFWVPAARAAGFGRMRSTISSTCRRPVRAGTTPSTPSR